MTDRFEIVDLPDSAPIKKHEDTTGVQPYEKGLNVLADNIDNIMAVVNNIVEIRRMEAQADLIIRKIEAETAALYVEAEAYVMKKNADTKSVVDKMQIVRQLLSDFSNYKNKSGMTVDEFMKIMGPILDRISME